MTKMIKIMKVTSTTTVKDGPNDDDVDSRTTTCHLSTTSSAENDVTSSTSSYGAVPADYSKLDFGCLLDDCCFFHCIARASNHDRGSKHEHEQPRWKQEITRE